MTLLRILSCLFAISFLLIGADCDVLHSASPPPATPPRPKVVEIQSAPVAVLKSPATSKSLGWKWDWEWSGATHTLDMLGVEYEVVTPEQLDSWDGEILILPNVRNMDKATVEKVEQLEAKILATYMTSYRNQDNEPWSKNNFALSHQLGVDFHSWVGSGDRAKKLKLNTELGTQEIALGRGTAMLVTPHHDVAILANWPDGEPAITQSAKGIFIGEDLFCPENSDSKPVVQLIGKLLNRLHPKIAQVEPKLSFSDLPQPPTDKIKKSGDSVRVGLGKLRSETLFRAPSSLSVNDKSDTKFHRWTPGTTADITGKPYLEVLRLRENGTYQWNAYRGSIRVDQAGNMTNTLDFEEYLAGVVPGEVPSYFPPESLKAMAVVARTYAKSHLGRHYDFDVCNSVHCQVYNGLGQESVSTNQAVAATTNEVLTFHRRPVDALFHAVCGGTTAASIEAWPSGSGKPYLSSRDDGNFCSHSGRYRWQKSISQDELTENIRTALEKTKGSRYVGCSEILALDVLERSESGRVRVLQIRTPETTYEVEGDSIRWLFSGGRISTAGLQSTLFELERTESGYQLRGGGWGHGVGMCQQGASGRARAGQSYKEILAHYYPQTALSGTQQTAQSDKEVSRSL